MKLSVVVPAFNEEKLLPHALGCIGAGLAAAFSAHGWGTELIVCDNNSTDRTAEVARAAGARLVFEPLNQIARARNAGARAADGDWLLFVDADSSPSTALLDDLRQAIEQGRCIGGGATLAFPSGRVDVRASVLLWNAMSRALSWAAGSFLFCEAGTFRAVGGFSEAFYAGEEIDLSRRLKRRGRFVILHRHPLATSDRKVHLYSAREHLGFLARFLVGGTRALQRRENCKLWYDGRR